MARKGGIGQRGRDGGGERGRREFSSMMEHWVYVYPQIIGQHKLDTKGLRETKKENNRERMQECEAGWEGIWGGSIRIWGNEYDQNTLNEIPK